MFWSQSWDSYDVKRASSTSLLVSYEKGLQVRDRKRRPEKELGIKYAGRSVRPSQVHERESSAKEDRTFLKAQNEFHRRRLSAHTQKSKVLLEKSNPNPKYHQTIKLSKKQKRCEHGALCEERSLFLISVVLSWLTKDQSDIKYPAVFSGLWLRVCDNTKSNSISFWPHEKVSYKCISGCYVY